MSKHHPTLRTNAAPRRAFTLIEILAVVAIIGLLAAILVPAISAAMRSAQKTVTKGTFAQWASAIASYKTTYGSYPPLNDTASDTEDSYYDLDNADQLKNFIRSLSARNLDGTELSTEEIKKYNERNRVFCTFDSSVFRNKDPKTEKLVDFTDNSRIHITLDTDGNNSILIQGELPGTKAELGLLDNNKKSCNILIYTLAKEAPGRDGENIFVAQ
ncbi:MAG: prepilin-type N-terminal cleavage/methylation domain-containing protein [Puniceicoccales bacterium]|jgi:prepilin-type N-terminal cleavage/methylation domain-containing protein|nr:prepilin-type N-terminal cleavage/methylation domain-containing protein [Puniceicoccales bacterium]